MDNWFTVDQIDSSTYIFSEYRHWEETHCYLLNGTERSLLIDTGLGIRNIRELAERYTDRPITAVATHVHWDHIGSHRYFPDFYAHEDELDWLSGGFPLPLSAIREMVLDRCDAPDDFDINSYEFFQGTPTRVLADRDTIDLGGRSVEVLHTPGHSPGHMCFWEAERGWLFTGDLAYKDMLLAYYPPPTRRPISPRWRGSPPCPQSASSPLTTHWTCPRKYSCACGTRSGSSRPKAVCATARASWTTATGAYGCDPVSRAGNSGRALPVHAANLLLN